MVEATRCLTLSEAGAKKKSKTRGSRPTGSHRFQPGLEWDILQADAVILLGLTNALRYVLVLVLKLYITLTIHSQRVLYGLPTMHVITSIQLINLLVTFTYYVTLATH